MRNALVLLGHADPESLNARLARAYGDALREAGAHVASITLSELSFDPVLRRGFAGEQSLEPDLLRVREAIEQADHLAWFFPTYWASPPAIVRGFVDRLFLPGWAFRYEEGASGTRSLPKGLLAGKSARVVTTMDSPAWWYTLARVVTTMDSPAWWYTLAHHRAIHGSFVTGTLSFVGLAPIRTTTIHEVRSLDPGARQAHLRTMASIARADLVELRPTPQHAAIRLRA
jgi:putative NADPH-quinone reductase